MKTTLTTVLLAAISLVATSCCCTGESKAPALKPLPQFQEIPQVQYSGK